MLEREQIIQELWRRIAGVSGVKFTARNPSVPPSSENVPSIEFFELPDNVTDTTTRGGVPVMKRKLQVAIEVFIAGSKDSAASKELMAFVKTVKAALYAGGPTFGGLCSWKEVEASRVMRPETGANLAGIGIVIEIMYVEDASKQ